MPKETFWVTAQKLSRTPLGVIALFVVAVEIIAGTVLAFSSNLTVGHIYIILSFICLFPLVVLGVFWHLVVFHNTKLYSPSEFNSGSDFLIANKLDASKTLQVVEDDLEGLIDAALERGETADLISKAVEGRLVEYRAATATIEEDLDTEEVEEIRSLIHSGTITAASDLLSDADLHGISPKLKAQITKKLAEKIEVLVATTGTAASVGAALAALIKLLF